MISTLRHIVQRVSQANTVEQAMAELVQLTRSAMQTDCCSLYLVESGSLLLSATEGLSADAVGRSRLKWGEGVVGLVAQREEPINLADAPKHKAFKLLPEAQEEAYRAFLAVPVIHRREALGVLVVQQKIARQFSEEEESFLVTLASQLAPQLRDRTLTRAQDPQSLVFPGLVAAEGIAIAPARLARPKLDLVQPAIESEDPELEWDRIERALLVTNEELAELGGRLSDEVAAELGVLFDCYQALLTDPQLRQSLQACVSEGWQAETAVSKVVCQYVGQFESMSDEYFRQRAADIRELGQRLLDQLARPGLASSAPEHPVILVAKEITAPMLAEIPRDKLAGIISIKGGVNSHAAILARAMGLPALVAVEGVRIDELADKTLVVDGLEGRLWIEPTDEVVRAFRSLEKGLEARSERFRRQLARPCVSADGQPVTLLLNAGLTSEERVLAKPGISGIGLYRTEALFMAFNQFPTEQQQERVYRRLLERADGKVVTVRTLDVGGDKPLPYLPIREDNPFLGWRGVRLSLDHPDLFLSQIRALLRAADGMDNLKIMVPMISRLEEIQSCRRLLEQAVNELTEELGRPVTAPPMGIMVEVPAALFQLGRWWQWLDFASVGSNDLTQYLLAVDRNNAQVSASFDSFHPSMVAALDQIAQQSKGKELGLCGELAGEVLGALMLLTLGYRQLSMNTQSLGAIHYLIENLNLSSLPSLRERLLSQADGEAVRQCLMAHLVEIGHPELVPGSTR
ncbi:phosphoenolpyruvate--protein phosphotransferase [Ferrimonas balearica]|uniref:phosphoenolpyruvate--protein phosphotransferase n=1 Tax=Ferrimonas balearica TaxID=44012 RepID=UPI001C9944E1|nr:phosphoenolpyruvate--protein phosphotransferase [Ferrimonas balearica]MBY5922880.1 phosphoenolpyruvate--protein phosphotransferase [Ferrimonas balearica]MBY5997743.1 phosphoenolpyruvate--protein phosphotransferase [Ferrimonas balearica]